MKNEYGQHFWGNLFSTAFCFHFLLVSTLNNVIQRSRSHISILSSIAAHAANLFFRNSSLSLDLLCPLSFTLITVKENTRFSKTIIFWIVSNLIAFRTQLQCNTGYKSCRNQTGIRKIIIKRSWALQQLNCSSMKKPEISKRVNN